LESLVRMFFDIFNEKKILITGDTGFKGSWLALWLAELGADVYGYSLPPLRKEDNYVICNLENQIKHIDGDVRDLKKLVNYFKEINPEIVFHMAAQALVLDSYQNPHNTFSTNVLGVVNVFEAIRLTPSVKVAINVTSDKCYKNNEWVWGYRETDPMGGSDPYSASKSASEVITSSYIQSFFSNRGTANVASVRAGNVIGAGDWSENRIIPDFYRALKTGEQLIIRNPNSTRPWQHVLEPLSGYLHLTSKLYSHGKQFQGGWNFGPIETTNRKVVDVIKSLDEGDANIDVGFDEYDAIKEAKLLKLDISKAMALLNWKPVLNFKETMKFTREGYISDISRDPARENRLQAIEIYTEMARSKKIFWSIN
jgi:CDP-glucose 4,6-dehydratase